INATGYVGAAVYPHNGSLVLSGDVQITGNSNQNGSACNVYLPKNKTLTIGGAHMDAGASVGVYCETMPAAPGETVDIATNAVEADSGHFFSDKMSEAGIKFDGDKVVLAYDARYIPQPGPDKPDPGVTVEPGPGKVTTWPKNPDPGTKVTVTIEPETGWEIDKVIIVTVPGGEPVVITGTNPITYIAPDPNTVKITVKYKRIPVDPKISGVSELLNSDTHIAFMVGDNFGKFNPRQGITRAETAQLFYNLLRNKDVDGGSFFDDVKTGLWYTEAVDTLAAMGILEGNGDGTYKPDENISRAEFTAIAMRFARSTKGEVTFTDVPAGYWAESAISGAAQYGWVMGYADGSFKPQGDITRGEAAKIVNTMLGRFPDTAFIDSAEGLKLFPDVTKNHWAFYQIAEASNAHGFTKENNVETWTK
ncbi:MAG: S-layer homology domain-containing protein, partial [Oscillospiraceae bacterium]